MPAPDYFIHFLATFFDTGAGSLLLPCPSRSNKCVAVEIASSGCRFFAGRSPPFSVSICWQPARRRRITPSSPRRSPPFTWTTLSGRPASKPTATSPFPMLLDMQGVRAHEQFRTRGRRVARRKHREPQTAGISVRRHRSVQGPRRRFLYAGGSPRPRISAYLDSLIALWPPRGNGRLSLATRTRKMPNIRIPKWPAPTGG